MKLSGKKRQIKVIYDKIILQAETCGLKLLNFIQSLQF